VTGLAGPQPPHRSLRAWKALQGGDLLGYVFVDEVLGRQDMITYAVGIDRSGRMGTLEILAYRESHGGEIRGTPGGISSMGARASSTCGSGLISKNIAGATLSCEHVTQGVRWIAALWQVTLRSGSPSS